MITIYYVVIYVLNFVKNEKTQSGWNGRKEKIWSLKEQKSEMWGKKNGKTKQKYLWGKKEIKCKLNCF